MRICWVRRASVARTLPLGLTYEGVCSMKSDKGRDAEELGASSRGGSYRPVPSKTSRSPIWWSCPAPIGRESSGFVGTVRSRPHVTLDHTEAS